MTIVYFHGNMSGNDSSQSPARVVSLHVATNRQPVNMSRNASVHPMSVAAWKVGRPSGGRLKKVNGGVCHTPSELWRDIMGQCRKRQTLWVVGHTMASHLTAGHFWQLWDDGKVVSDRPMAKRLDDGSIKPGDNWQGAIVLESPPFILTVRHTASGGRMVFVDIMNYFPTPLANMAEGLGIEPLPKPGLNSTDDYALEYSLHAVEVVERTFCELVEWVSVNDMGCFKYTAAAQAMASYRHRFMRLSNSYVKKSVEKGRERVRHRRIGLINVGHSAAVKAVERKSYFGGRVELFRVGKLPGTVYCLDVNSLYPSVMAGNKYPFRLKATDIDDSTPGAEPPSDLSTCIADVTLETGADTYPTKYGKYSCQCRGIMRTTLAGPELEHASSKGHIAKIHSFSDYHCTDIFTPFVHDLWLMRKAYQGEGNELYQKFVKMLLNSLHGKFAQKSTQWLNRNDIIAPESWYKWYTRDLTTGKSTAYRSVGMLAQQLVNPGESKTAFPAIASFVTSYGRQVMRHMIEAAGHENVHSISTDCLWTNAEGYERLVESNCVADNDLGKLRLQYQTDDIEFIATNCYRVDGVVKASGLKSDAIEIPGEGYSEERYNYASALWRTGSSSEVESYTNVQDLARGYAKGNIMADGRVEPFTLGNDGRAAGLG